VLSGVVYKTKRRGPRTEPWGNTAYERKRNFTFDTKTAIRQVRLKPF